MLFIYLLFYQIRSAYPLPVCAYAFHRRKGVVPRLCVCLPQKKGHCPPPVRVSSAEERALSPACAYAFHRRRGVVPPVHIPFAEERASSPPPVRVSSEGVKASGRYLTSRTEGNCEFSNVTSAATRRKPSLGRHCTGGGTTSLTLGRHMHRR